MRIEGLSVSALYQAKHERLFGCFLAVADHSHLVNPHGHVIIGRNRKAHFGGKLVAGLTLGYARQDQDQALGQLTDFNSCLINDKLITTRPGGLLAKGFSVKLIRDSSILRIWLI